MADVGEVNNFLEEIAFLESVFGETVSSSVIESIIESCNGDVHLAADTIMNFTSETPTAPPEESAKENSKENTEIPVHVTSVEPTVRQESSITISPESQEVQTLTASFSEAFRNTGAIPKKPLDPKIPRPYYTKNIWPDQIGLILNHHNEGSRILILMRGATGSGKTYLAKNIIDYTVGVSPQNYARHIFSTDSYFMRGGVYQFNRNALEEAHTINQRKVCEATNKGISPIIVDNTNMELWEMDPYARYGVRNGYIIEIVEPNTPWAKNANQLFKKNIHGVPREKIRRMLDRYEKRITPDSLLKTLKLAYPVNKKPPVKRNFPAISSPESTPISSEKTTLHTIEYNSGSGASTSNVEIFHFKSPDSPDKQHHDAEITHIAKIESTPTNDNKHALKLQKIIEAEKKFEQFQKVEKEWDNGESWDVKAENINSALQDQAIALDPKPPREAQKNDTDKLIEPASICDDWTKISMFMPPWQDKTSSNVPVTFENLAKVETESISTCFEVGDMNEDIHKVLYGTLRYINEGIPENKISKMPKVVMLDKSTSTQENDFLIEKKVCKNKEHHFRQLRGIFRSVPRNVLRDIFESCNCDSNWTFDLMHGFYPGRQDNGDNNEDMSDLDEEPIEEPIEDCNCLAAYDIIPDIAPGAPVSPAPEKISEKSTPTLMSQKKTKKESKLLSDSSLQLKRQIESNVMISDSHYSQHYLDMRRRREIHHDSSERASGSAQFNANIENVANTNTFGDDKIEMNNAVALPEAYTQNAYNPNDIRDIVRPSTSHYNFEFMDPIDSDTESDSNKSDNPEKTVSVNIGAEFLEKLDELFGRQGFQYPDNIKPVVSLPMSILQQINAHWTMSVALQMDDVSNQSEAMVKQDEDFARQLADKEQEMYKEGVEPDVPSLKEIMDMELAYSIYEREIAEWRNNEPQDLAARLSREKLYNLFPELSKDVLSEMLMAHEYSFKCTIESLIISTGQTSWLEDEKGIEKFVMHKETQRKEKFLEEQKKTLDDAEWPYLGKPEKPINLETVNYYREQAQKYLLFRNKNFEKAKSYLNVNSYAASFYSEIAALHTRKYEQSSSLAAAYLMNYHLMNNPDQNFLDLHFLRVPEAMVNLDIFLDQTILILRDRNIYLKETWIITGKGAHSPGGPRIKPAAKRRLKARGIRCKEVNAGLLAAQLHPTHKMTNELEQLENS